MKKILNETLDEKLSKVAKNLQEENTKLKGRIQCLELEVDSLNSYTRKNTVEMNRVPTQLSEELLERACKISNMISEYSWNRKI